MTDDQLRIARQALQRIRDAKTLAEAIAEARRALHFMDAATVRAPLDIEEPLTSTEPGYQGDE